MNRTLVCGVAATIVLAAGAPAVVAGASARDHLDRRSECTIRDVSGTYGLVSSGVLDAPPPGIPAGPFAAVGRLVINRDGSISADATQSFNGTIFQEQASPGVITVEPDCTGSLTLGGVQTFDLVVSDHDERIDFLQTNPGTVITITATRQ
jgi:hypothetical protein